MGHTAADTTGNTTPILAPFKAQGGQVFCRYIASGGSYKLIHKPEVDAIHAAGLSVLLNFEGRGNDINAFSGAMGTNDATLSLNCARNELGAPVGTAIYFSCEPENLGSMPLATAYALHVLPYFRAVRSVLGTNYRVGAYTFGAWLDWLFRDGAIDFAWLPGASGWAGYQAFLASNRWAIRQVPGQLEQNFHGIAVDWDEVNPTLADIGVWAATGGQPPVVVPPATSHPTLRKGSRGAEVIVLQTLLHITADGDFGPLTEKAVKTFQAALGLVVDGVVGEKTWAKLAPT